MQNYVEITEDTPIKDSREQFLANDKTIASHFAGTAFPTENIVVGMECYRTDQKVKYRLTSLSPVTWERTIDAGPVGPKGDKGDMGPQGVQGLKGDTGATGATGAQGPRGIQGAKGDKGDTGPQGPKGTTGVQGPQGVQGAKGDKGDAGPTGATGARGPQGVQGPAGSTSYNAGTVGGYSVGNAANRIPVYNASGHLVLPSGSELWVE